jgi:hypothetical protein
MLIGDFHTRIVVPFPKQVVPKVDPKDEIVSVTMLFKLAHENIGSILLRDSLLP